MKMHFHCGDTTCILSSNDNVEPIGSKVREIDMKP